MAIETSIFLALCDFQAPFSPILLSGSFPAWKSFLIHMYWSALECLGERRLSADLCTTLSCLVFCPAHSSCRLPETVFSTRTDYVLFCVLQSGNFLSEINWGSPKCHLICFLSIGDCWPWLPNGQYFECCHFIVQFFSYFKWEGKSSSYYSILIGSRSPQIHSLLNYLKIYKATISRHNAEFREFLSLFFLLWRKKRERNE